MTMPEMPDDPAMSNTAVFENDEWRRLSWREIAETARKEVTALNNWRMLCMDLDRCRHGRHEGDACFGCEGGYSTGNPMIWPERCIGFDIGGIPYSVPERFGENGGKFMFENWREKS